MFERLADLETEFEDLQARLGDPELLADHLRRYRTAYLRTDERRDLSARVQELATAHRRAARLEGPLPTTPRWGRRPPVAARPTPPPDEQLRLV